MLCIVENLLPKPPIRSKTILEHFCRIEPYTIEEYKNSIFINFNILIFL
jgi:hypothetical protein